MLYSAYGKPAPYATSPHRTLRVQACHHAISPDHHSLGVMRAGQHSLGFQKEKLRQ